MAGIEDISNAFAKAKAANDVPNARRFAQMLVDYAPPVIPAPVIPAPVTPAPEVEGNLLRETLDIPLKLGSGVLTGTKMVTDVFGADNAVSSGLGAAEEWLSNLVSAQSKADSAEIARIMQEAEDLGFMGQAKAALNALTVAPIDFLAQGVGTFVPAIAAAIGGGAVGVGAYGVSSGVGLIKDTIYDAVREELVKSGKSEKEAEAAATEAQSYTGENIDMIVAGGGLGYLASRFGVPEAFIKGKLGQRLIEKFGQEGSKGILREIGKGAVREGIPEGMQAGQEKFAGNLALAREGFDVPLSRGVSGQAVLEGVIGGILGGGMSTIETRAADKLSEPSVDGVLTPEQEQERAELASQVEAATAEAAGRKAARVQTYVDEGMSPQEAQEAEEIEDNVQAEVRKQDAQKEVIDQEAQYEEEDRAEVIALAQEAFNTSPERNEAVNEQQANVAQEYGPELAALYESTYASLASGIAPEVAAEVAAEVELAPEVAPEVAPEGDADQQIDFVAEEEQAKTLYHVTFTENVPSIKEKGLEQMRPSLWSKGEGGVRYNEEAGIFAFDNPQDAMNWAAKMKFDLEGGDSPISIMRLGMEDGTWESDPASGTLNLSGQALRSGKNIQADKIIDSFDDVDISLVGRETLLPQLEAPPSNLVEESSKRTEAGKKSKKKSDEQGRQFAKEIKVAEKAVADSSVKSMQEVREQYGFENEEDYENIIDDDKRRSLVQAKTEENYAALVKEEGFAPEVTPEVASDATPKDKKVSRLAVIAASSAPKIASEKAAELRGKAESQANTEVNASLKKGRMVEAKLSKKKDALENALGNLWVAQNNRDNRSYAARQTKAAKVFDNLTPEQKVIAEEKGKEKLKAIGLQESKRKVLRSVRSDRLDGITDQNYNDSYRSAKTTTELLDKIIATGNRFEKFLARRLKPLVKNVKLIIGFQPTQMFIEQISGVAPPINPANYVRDEFGYLQENPEGQRGNYSALPDWLNEAMWAEESQGLYFPSENTVFLNTTRMYEGDDSAEGLNNTTILHEFIHAATVNVIFKFALDGEGNKTSPRATQAIEDIRTLMSEAQETYFRRMEGGLRDGIENLAERADIFNDIYEFVAYGLTEPSFQEFLTKVTPDLNQQSKASVNSLRNALGKFLNSIREILGLAPSEFNGFVVLTDLTGTLLEENPDSPRISAADIKRAVAKTKRASAAAEKVAKSQDAKGLLRNMFSAVTEIRDVEGAVNFLKGTYDSIDSNRLRAMLGAYTTDGINRVFGDKVKLNEIDSKVEALNITRGQRLKELAEKIPGWQEFNGLYEEGAGLLADIMSLATLNNFDPLLHKDKAAALKNDAELNLKKKALARAQRNPNSTKGTINYRKGRVTGREKVIKEFYDGAIIKGERVAGWDRLQEEANGGQRGVEIFRMARDSYRQTLEDTYAILRKKIENSEIKQEAKDELLKTIADRLKASKVLQVYFPLMRYGEFWLRVGKGQRREFYMFESELERNLFARERAKEVAPSKDFTKALEDEDVQVGKNTGDNQFRQEMEGSSEALKTVFDLIDDKALSKEDVQIIKDNVYQMYLMTLSSSDMRRKFVHRKGVTGFSKDALRNFVVTQHTSANQLARLEYTDDIRNAIETAKGALDKNPEEDKLLIVVEEIATRAMKEVNPPERTEGVNWDAVAGLGNKAVFYWLLSAPKSALVQLTQLPIVGLPVLSAEFKNADVAGMVARYTKMMLTGESMAEYTEDENGVGKTNWLSKPSISDSKYIQQSPIRAALEEAFAHAAERELFMQTYASDLTGQGKVSTREFSGAPSKVFRNVANFMSGGFHHLERINREVMFMSSFELAYAEAVAQKLSPEEAQKVAQERAMKLTYAGLFNYSNYNKPRYMTANAPMKMATQFMTFPMQMTSYLVRNFFKMLPFVNKEGKAAAATQFFGTMGMTFLFAGATGLPMYTAMMGLMEGIREANRPDEDDEDADFLYDLDELTNNPMGMRNMDIWFRQIFIPRYFGEGSSLADFLGLSPEQAAALSLSIEMGPISALTGLNIGASTSLDGMWFRDDGNKDNSEDALVNFTYNTTLGPFGSIARSASRALDDFKDGDYGRAAENALPAMFRNIAKTMRLYEEGLVTRQGNVVADAEYYTTFKLFGQALGLSDTEVATDQEFNFLAKNMVTEMQTERGDLLNDLDKAVLEYQKSDVNDPNAYDGIQEVQDEIVKFNYRNPWMLIKASTQRDSLKGKAERRGNSSQGLNVTKELEKYVFPLREDFRNR